jgi:hypothetical protein
MAFYPIPVEHAGLAAHCWNQVGTKVLPPLSDDV